MEYRTNFIIINADRMLTNYDELLLKKLAWFLEGTVECGLSQQACKLIDEVIIRLKQMILEKDEDNI